MGDAFTGSLARREGGAGGALAACFALSRSSTMQDKRVRYIIAENQRGAWAQRVLARALREVGATTSTRCTRSRTARPAFPDDQYPHLLDERPSRDPCPPPQDAPPRAARGHPAKRFPEPRRLWRGAAYVYGSVSLRNWTRRRTAFAVDPAARGRSGTRAAVERDSDGRPGDDGR